LGLGYTGEGPPGREVLRRAGRILVVDDERLVAKATGRVLGYAGYDVTVSDLPAEVLEAILGGLRFDAIICDMVMPELSGDQFYEKLMRSCPDQARRMVFVTGGVLEPRQAAFLDDVPNRWLMKPFSGEDLLRMVQQTIGLCRS
jgi:CheY-like chemotaxis protein